MCSTLILTEVQQFVLNKYLAIQTHFALSLLQMYGTSCAPITESPFLSFDESSLNLNSSILFHFRVRASRQDGLPAGP